MKLAKVASSAKTMVTVRAATATGLAPNSAAKRATGVPRQPRRRPGAGAAGTFRASVTPIPPRSEEHTSELQSLMRNSSAVFCLKTKQQTNDYHQQEDTQTHK